VIDMPASNLTRAVGDPGHHLHRDLPMGEVGGDRG
jgi:hypothetical protein